MASGDVASIKEATIGKGYFPAVALKDYALKWYPNADSMFINTQGKSFSFYKGTTSLEGSLLLRSTGLYGNGKLKRPDSELLLLISNSIRMVFWPIALHLRSTARTKSCQKIADG
jgi:hypothetical protein